MGKDRKIIKNIKAAVRNRIWQTDYLTDQQKIEIIEKVTGFLHPSKYHKGMKDDNSFTSQYIRQVLQTQRYEENRAVPLSDRQYERQAGDSKLIAYYLTQFCPNPYNDAWWGKGVTEWNNVSKSQPQYLGHYQPRLPGELGYYDLRLDENIERQVELAKQYGIYGFDFYFYWFDGKRLLEGPLDRYIANKNIDFPFALCWVNESWTKQWSGRSFEVLMEQNPSVESYRQFIVDMAPYLCDERYITVKGRKLLTIYRPFQVPEPEQTIAYWRQYMRDNYGIELYLVASIGVYEHLERMDYLAVGYDALSEFCIAPQVEYMRNITAEKQFACEKFVGEIYSYPQFVKEKGYLKRSAQKMYRAISPMWDNTPRRMNAGLVLDGSTPELFQAWLGGIMQENKERGDLDDDIIFINAWNEWAEGAYMEPDAYWGYGYLDAARQALEESRAWQAGGGHI